MKYEVGISGRRIAQPRASSFYKKGSCRILSRYTYPQEWVKQQG